MSAHANSRFAELTWPERHMIHHALRVLVRHPLTSAADTRLASAIADEIWEEHAEWVASRVAALAAAGRPAGEEG